MTLFHSYGLICVYGIPGAEALAVQNRLSALLILNMNQEYSELCGFVRVRMSLAIVRSNIPKFRGHRDKGVRIPQGLELLDGAVMGLLMPWRG